MWTTTKAIPAICVLIAAAASSGGCATIVNGSDQTVAIASNPPNATVELDDGRTFKTPATIKFARKRDHVVTISLDGYETEQVTLMRTISGSVAGNIIAGGFIGWGIDAMTGSQYKLMPAAISVDLRPMNGSRTLQAAMPSDSLSPESRLRQLKQLHEDGLLNDDEYETSRIVIIREMQGSK